MFFQFLKFFIGGKYNIYILDFIYIYLTFSIYSHKLVWIFFQKTFSVVTCKYLCSFVFKCPSHAYLKFYNTDLSLLGTGSFLPYGLAYSLWGHPPSKFNCHRNLHVHSVKPTIVQSASSSITGKIPANIFGVFW